VAVIKEAQQLKQVPLLSSLDSKQLKLLAFTCEVFDFADGDYLFRQGDASDCVYVILAGQVEIIGEKDGAPVHLATSPPNSLIGADGRVWRRRAQRRRARDRQGDRA